MAGLSDLTAQSLGSNKTFNWTWFIELITCGILVVWFVFYFNRLFATIVSAALRAYTWHKFRVYIDIQSLQISLLGGRLFFKGIRYYGENETVYVHSGHLTWRYWLRLTRHIDLSQSFPWQNSAAKDDIPPRSSGSTENVDETEKVSSGQPRQKHPNAEARLAIHVTGLEWFIYNRTPVYDSIVRDDSVRPGSTGSPQASRATAALAKAVENKFKRKSAQKKEAEDLDSDSESSPEDETLEKQTTTKSSFSGHNGQFTTLSETGSTRTGEDAQESADINSAHSLILRFLPLGIECSRGSISLGNEHTKALIVTTFEKARGHIDASGSGPADIYKQIFDFDVEHPLVQMRPNPDYHLPQMSAAERIIAGTDSVLKRRSWWKLNFDFRRRKRGFVQHLRHLLPGLSRSVESFHQDSTHDSSSRAYTPFADVQADGGEWHGLDRYMDEDDADDHQAWMNIEYARFSTVVDCPSVHLTFYWDTPGTVKQEHLDAAETGLARDINGIHPPAYGLDLVVHGGTVNYGPWTDRLRAELQTIFLPNGYKIATPTTRLDVGDPRQSSTMVIRVEVEDEITLRVPVREGSKDWRWRGRATAVRDAAALRKQQERKHFRFRRGHKRRLGPEVRPFGWFSVAVGAGSKVRYEMDMVAGLDGYRNNLKLNLLSTKATSSVNHAILWECKKQDVVADLSNPLEWNALHTWRFNLNSKGMDLFLLRDHTFLLLDLIADFTAGQKSDYMTFMPFAYQIGISFTDFNLYLNANDFNIIDNPREIDDNAFLILGFELLAGEVGIPMKYFSPAQNHVSFSGHGRNGSLTLKTPLWSTISAFSKDETMATLKSLKLDGVYNYYAGTSSKLTDSLFMNIIGGNPKFHLQGFLIRYFMNVKENYFGENIHFNTLEEYQNQLDPDHRHSSSGKKAPPKKQNDLDVILSVRADQCYALMPANLYERSENLRVDVLLVEADMRFTNYYMDLQVNSSPIEVAIEKEVVKESKISNDVTSCQLFIGGVVVYGHRLFGAPPSEPTYVCNWDFDVGQILGECSSDFLRIAVAAVQAFIFTMDDDENALPKVETLIPDITFLRARTAGIRTWLVSGSTAFLVELSPANVSLNDWSNAHFSESVQVYAPSLTVAAVDAQTAYRQREQKEQKIPVLACIQTSVRLAVLSKKPDFSQYRALQQQHVRFHDQRTHRAEWLLHKLARKPLQTTKSGWAREAPAMPVPEMPEPVNIRDVSQGLLRASASKNTLRSHRSFISDESLNSLKMTIPATTESEPFHQSKEAKTGTASKSFLPSQPYQNSMQSPKASLATVSLSSPWSAPLFPLQRIKPDFSRVPAAANPIDHVVDADVDVDQAEDFDDRDEHVKHDGIFCNLAEGIRGFCTPDIFFAISYLLQEVSPKRSADVLDAIQLKTISNIKNLTVERMTEITDLSFRLPYAHIRMSNEQRLGGNASIVDQYDVRIERAKISVRIVPQQVKTMRSDMRPMSTLLHTAVDSIMLDASEAPTAQSSLRSNGHVALRDIGLWLSLQDTIRARTQLSDIHVQTAGRTIDSLAALIQRTGSMVDDIVHEFRKIDQDSHVQHLIYHLTSEETVSDPLCLSRPSYVLRTAPEHVRLNDSWKILSRLRNTLSAMESSTQKSLRCDDQCEAKKDPGNTQKHVISAFDQWKTWEGNDSADGPIVKAIFGTSKVPGKSFNHLEDVELEVLLGQATLVLDPGPQQSQFKLQSLDLNFSDIPISTRRQAWTFQRPDASYQRKTIQSYCGGISVELSWEVLELVDSILDKIPVQTNEISRARLEFPNAQNQALIDEFVFIFGTDNISVQVNTINLSLLLAAERLKHSMVLTHPEAGLQEISVFLTSDTARLRLDSKHQTLLGWKLSSPSVYACHTPEHSMSQRSEAARFAATCEKLRFSLKEDPLVCLRLCKAVIQDEVATIERLSTTIKSKTSSKKHSDSKQKLGLGAVHVALLLNNYKLDFALTPSLLYSITGQVARTSVVPRSDSRFTVNFDIKDNHHTFVKSGSARRGAPPVLSIPPINGRVTVGISPKRLSIDTHATVEVISLEASALRACFEAAYSSETTNYVKLVKSEILEVQRLSQEMQAANPASQTENASPEITNAIQYTANAIVAGLEIHCAAPVHRDDQQYQADLRLRLGQMSVKLHNVRTDSEKLYRRPQFESILRQLSISLERQGKISQNFGQFVMDLRAVGTTEFHDDHSEVQDFRIMTTGIQLDLHEETAALTMDVVKFLQQRLKELTEIEDAKNFRPLRRFTIVSPPAEKSEDSKMAQDEDGNDPSNLFDSVYTVDVHAIRVRWILSQTTFATPGSSAEDLVFSIARMDLSTKREGSARLAIANTQLQIVPKSSTNPVERSANSALLPQMVFNAASVSGKHDRRFAFKAAGKAVDIRLAADFIVPASQLQKSLARASNELRNLQLALPKADATSSQAPVSGLLGQKRLASLLIYADFAGAIITVTPKTEEEPGSAFGMLKGSKRSRAGRYGQAVQSGNTEEATLRAPGIALQVEYGDTGTDVPTLSTELKVAASSNTLAPSVVPLLLEISSSITNVMGKSDVESKVENHNTDSPPKQTTSSDESIASDPTAILGRVKLNAGLWIQRQEFSLTCQPIARVSATAKFDDIFVTINTVQAQDQERFFSIMTTFNKLAASVQHVYSRESTASFEVDSIVMSLMNSKHFSNRSGISAILNITPMKADLNAKQMQDFLLFREIWYPAELRQAPKAPAPAADVSSSQLNAIQRYQEITATSALPWHAIVSLQELKLQVDFGPSIGKSSFITSNLWASSKKNSDSEQNLCIGFDKVGVESSGRMSGFVELQGFRVRTAIRWPRLDTIARPPLVQGSIGFEHLRAKAAFDYQPFGVADISSFEFLMYNVRHQQNKESDRLVGILDGGKVQVFCTTSAAAQSLSIWQAFERLIQEKREAYRSSLTELDRYLRRKSVFPAANWTNTSVSEDTRSKAVSHSSHSISLRTDVVITLKAIDIGAFPNTFVDQQLLKVEAVDVQARFAVGEADGATHSGLGMSLGQVRVALSSVSRPAGKALGEVAVTEVIERASSSRGGTILKVPRLVASMETWQKAQSNTIEYIFSSVFQGKVDVGWNYSRISAIRGMWDSHSKALGHRLGKPLPPSAVKITAEPQGEGIEGARQEKITAVVNMPQSKYDYVPLEPPIIDTPQLRDLGEATPSLEWIGLHREKLPNVTHSVIIVTLIELAKEVEESYSRILGLG